ncbi:LysR family transcriptional regulator [Orrella sp. JC864]|uniref:LysR family transcriptional regulator n=1 Tax=Orrella sp. JC864 TaxID=3120298 RepID=UPI00300A0929
MERPPSAPPSSSHARQRMDWNLLRTFLFVVQERGVGRAAAVLHLSQPAVSQALRRLEESVGGQLLVRRHGEFRLTPLGEDVYAIACEVYGTVARIDAVAAGHQDEVAGPLRLLVMSRIHSLPYDEFLADFHRRHPRIEFQVEVMPSSAILDALAKRQPGLGICLCRKPVEGLNRRLFMRQRYVVVCGRHHPLFSRGQVSLHALQDQDFVRFASDQIGDTLSPLTIFRDQRGFTGRIVGTSSNIEEIRRMVIAGMGLSWLPEHMIVRDIEAQLLRRLPPDEGVAEIDVFFVWNAQRKLTAPEAAFRSAFEAFLRRTPLASRAF